NVGAQTRVSEHNTQNAGIAMCQRAHGIESMRGVPSSGCDTTFGGHKVGVGVPQTHANSATCRLRNKVLCAFEFGRDGHHPNMSARCLPEPIKRFNLWRKQVFGWMNALSRMAEKRTFQVYTEWASTAR